MSYDIKFRQQVLKVRQKKKLSFAQVAELFRVGKQTVYNWSKRLETKKKRKRIPWKISDDALACDVKKYPDAYNYERAARLKVSTSGIFDADALRRIGYTYKKNSSTSKSKSTQKSSLVSAS